MAFKCLSYTFSDLFLIVFAISELAFCVPFLQMIFDPTMTRKKKKKKKPFMLEEEGTEAPSEDTQPLEPKEADAEGGEEREMDHEEDEAKKKGRSNRNQARGWFFGFGFNEVASQRSICMTGRLLLLLWNLWLYMCVKW